MNNRDRLLSFIVERKNRCNDDYILTRLDNFEYFFRKKMEWGIDDRNKLLDHINYLKKETNIKDLNHCLEIGVIRSGNVDDCLIELDIIESFVKGVIIE